MGVLFGPLAREGERAGLRHGGKARVGFARGRRGHAPWPLASATGRWQVQSGLASPGVDARALCSCPAARRCCQTACVQADVEQSHNPNPLLLRARERLAHFEACARATASFSSTTVPVAAASIAPRLSPSPANALRDPALSNQLRHTRLPCIDDHPPNITLATTTTQHEHEHGHQHQHLPSRDPSALEGMASS